MRLSATIITLNEEKDLPRCLNSLKGWVDEIIIVDCGSQDNTVNIAKDFGAKVFINSFENFALQKNFAQSKADGEWILSVDADEEIERELAGEIIKGISSGSYDAFSMPRKNIIFGKFIEHTRWNPELDRQVWLWKKGKAKWVGDVHEKVHVNGKIGRMVNSKIHYQYENVSEFIAMMNAYSELESDSLVQSGVRFSAIKLFGQPLYNFAVRYFYRQGFLDGWRGFVLSYLMAIYHFLVWVKVWHKNGLGPIK